MLHEKLLQLLESILRAYVPRGREISPLGSAEEARSAVLRSVVGNHTSPVVLHLHHENDPPVSNWQHISDTVTRYRLLPVKSFEGLYPIISKALRNVVTRDHEHPALIVLQLDPTYSLLPALDVCRTLADTYNMHLHIEGGACILPLINQPLIHDPANLFSADTVLINFTDLLHLRLCGVFLVGMPCRPSDDIEQVARLFCLAYVLDRVGLSTVSEHLSRACVYVSNLSDCLYRVTHLMQAELIGVGTDLLICYSHQSPERQLEVNRSLLPLLEGATISQAGIHLSALNLLSYPCDDAEQTAVDIVRRIRICEQAMVLAPSFVSHVRQNVDIYTIRSEKACFIAGIQITPLGHVPKVPKWQKDPHTLQIVEKHTKAFVTAHVTGFGVVYDEGVAWIMPLLGGALNEGESTAEGIERLANDWETCEASGVLIADQVGLVVAEVIAACTDVRTEPSNLADGQIIDTGEAPPFAESVSTEEAELSPLSMNEQGAIVTLEEHVDEEFAEESIESLNDAVSSAVEEVEEEARKASKLASEVGTEHTGNGETTQRSSGFWGLIFGDKGSDGNSDSDDVDGRDPEELEDDYFRP